MYNILIPHNVESPMTRAEVLVKSCNHCRTRFIAQQESAVSIVVENILVIDEQMLVKYGVKAHLLRVSASAVP